MEGSDICEVPEEQHAENIISVDDQEGINMHSQSNANDGKLDSMCTLM